MNKISVPITAICLALSGAAMVAQAADSTFVITSGKDNYWKVGTFTEGTGGTTVTVNENQKNQKWLGFAGCFNEAGWDALGKLSESERDKAIKLLFNKKDGIGFAYGRIPIGASDYALDRYTLNQSKDDFEMKNFSIDRDKNCLIKYIKAAQAVKPDLRFWASAWTPPTWMKTGAADADGYDGGEMKNDPKYLAANALYTARFCEEYKAQGITINMVVPQNEPGYTQHYPSCGWGRYRLPDGSNAPSKPEYLSTYVANYLEDTLKKRSPETDIWYGCLSNDATAPDYWSGAKANAKQIIKGLGVQWNCKSLVKGAATDGYLTMCSEHQCGNYPWKPEATSLEAANSETFWKSMAPNNHAYGEESWGLIRDWIKEGVNIYSAWNMVLDTKGLNLDKSRVWPQNALLVVDTQAKTLKATAYYYVVRHIGQYVDSGAVRLTTSGGDALAFFNPDSSIVAVAFNSGASAAQTTIAVGGKNYKISIPSKGWATLCTKWKNRDIVQINTSRNKAHTNISGLKITAKGNGYTVAIPSSESGRIELLTVNGRVLESRAIPQGSREVMLRKPSHSGVLLVRVNNGSEAKTAQILNY